MADVQSLFSMCPLLTHRMSVADKISLMAPITITQLLSRKYVKSHILPWFWLWATHTIFLPDPPPPAGLVYILNFPSVCVSVCLSLAFSPWSGGRIKKSQGSNYTVNFARMQELQKNCQKVVPNITKPLPHHLCTVGVGLGAPTDSGDRRALVSL